MKTLIFTFLALISFHGLSQHVSNETSPMQQTVLLQADQFSPIQEKSVQRASSDIALLPSFEQTSSISINLQVFLKTKPKTLNAQLLNKSSSHIIQLVQDSHVDPLDPAIYFSPVELIGGSTNYTLVLNTDQINIDSVFVRALGFHKVSSFSPIDNEGTPSIAKDYTNCTCSQPSHTNRNGWGCPQGLWGTTATLPTHLVVHHEGVGPNTSSNWANRVYGIWNYHVNTLGWSDIGYNWLIDPNGVIYEGRYSSSSGDPQGAHWVCNAGSMSVCMLGEYSSTTITSQAKASLEELLAWKACDQTIDPVSSSYNSAQMATLNNICGHLDGPCSSTVCPGSGLYSQLPSIRLGVLAEINACSPGGGTGEDIFLTNVSVSNNTLAAGDNFTAYATQNYSGNQTTSQLPSFDLDYYLSTDCNLDNNDVLLGGDISSIGSNDLFDDEYETLTIPPGTAQGNYFILFAADNDQELQESDESNNIVCIPITVGTPSGENIFLTNVSVSTATLSPGDSFTAYATQNYSGNQTTSQLPSFVLDYYLSTDCNLDNNDVFLGDDLSSIGSNDPDDPENEDLIIPNGTTSGNYYILFVADADDQLVEVDETDNVVCIPIQITTPPNPCDVPANLLTSTISQVSADLNWSASSNASSYELQWREVSASIWIDETPTSNSIQLGSLLCESTYEWRVRSVCGGGTFSAWSTAVTFTTNDCNPTGCDAPTSPQTINITSTSATLYWTEPIGGTDYESQWRQVGVPNWTIEISQDYFENISGLAFNTTYEWKVRTICNNGGFSDWSNIVLFTTDDSVNDIEEADIHNVSIYPNPTYDMLHINNCMGMSLELVDNIGRIVHEQTCSENDVEIDLSHFAAGTYTLFFSVDQINIISKVIKL
ncbi:MAG: fibronectin type III domain-containing protein [Crocinitomicaceae bacterium]